MNERFKEEYKQKLVSMDEAVKVVRSGDWIEYAFGINGANELDRALSKRKDELLDVNIRCDIGIWPHYTNDVDSSGEHFYWNSWHFGALDRKYYNQGTLSYIPMKFHECPQMTSNDCIQNRVFMATVSPMDRHGYFSFGSGAPSSWAAIENAESVILEVNTNMPRVLGGNKENIHISQVNYVTESSNPPLPVLSAAEPTAEEKKIAMNIIDHLHDGCCIQLGIGGVPNAVGHMVAESDLRDLGVHTEMYVDAYLEMTKAGRVTGAKKQIDQYKQAFSFAMGSAELYDFIDDNPGVISYAVDYMNSPTVVAQLDNFVSINACIEVDLFGQVCSESVGTRHISGTGGQLDFVEGAYKSKGGQSFICMTSTFKSKNGITSRIKPTLALGSIVTSPRTATHKIVTEYGIAGMKGKATWQRAEELISIAHPDYRDDLVREAEKMKIWKKSNKI